MRVKLFYQKGGRKMKKLLLSLLLVTCLTGMVWGQTAQEKFAEAMATFRAGDYVTAQTQLQGVCDDTTASKNLKYRAWRDQAVCQWKIGHTYRAKKDYANALIEYEKTVTDYPKDTHFPSILIAIRGKASCYIFLKDNQSALNEYLRGIADFPDYPREKDPICKKIKELLSQFADKKVVIENAIAKLKASTYAKSVVARNILIGDLIMWQTDEAPLNEMKALFQKATRAYLRAKRNLGSNVEANKKQIKELNNKIIDIKKTMASLEID